MTVQDALDKLAKDASSTDDIQSRLLKEGSSMDDGGDSLTNCPVGQYLKKMTGITWRLGYESATCIIDKKSTVVRLPEMVSKFLYQRYSK
jgi:hypothetical protein